MMDDDTIDLMRKLLSLVSRYPDGAFTTTDDGVRIEWRRGDLSVVLQVDATQSYLYRSLNGMHGIVHDPTPALLDEYLR